MFFRRDKMKTIYFSTNENILDEWTKKFQTENSTTVYDLESLQEVVEKDIDSIIVVDYDSVAHEINTLITANELPKNVIILEKAPIIPTGKNLIYSGVKAYGNSRMLKNHFKQMWQTVADGQIWTYPVLTTALVSSLNKPILNEESLEVIQSRLTKQEIILIYLILKGFNNNAIAEKLNVTIRTVKAHITSIFNKLHVNDRVSLILLLK